MPDSSRKNRGKRRRRSRSGERGDSEQQPQASIEDSAPSGRTRLSEGGMVRSVPRIRPRTWKKIRRWSLYVALVVFAAAIIGSFVIQGIPLGGGGGGGETGTGEDVGERIAPMPVVYRPSNHIGPGSTYEGEYNSTPPTSGPHWDTGWAGCGFFEEESPDEQVVHNMEHGQVIISYNLSDEGQIEQVREIARSLPGRRSWMIMRPYSKIGAGRIALTAWGWKDEFSISGLTEERVRSFYDAHRNNSGVESIPCGGYMS